MNENTKVAIKVEYECDGIKKVCLGEIEESKLEKLKKLMNIDAGEENYILMENDGNIIWKDKESLISIETLDSKSVVFRKDRIADYIRANNDTDIGICS